MVNYYKLRRAPAKANPRSGRASPGSTSFRSRHAKRDETAPSGRTLHIPHAAVSPENSPARNTGKPEFLFEVWSAY